MKKKVMIALAILAGVIVLGFGIYQSGASTSEPELSSDEIRDLVKVQYPGTVTELEFEKDSNNSIYHVGIESNGKVYRLNIDGNTGEVLDLKVNENAGGEHKAQKGKEDTKLNDSKQEKSTKEKIEIHTSDTNSERDSSNAMISEDRAKEIALVEFSGTISEIELDEDDGIRVYEVEIENGEDEAMIEINAYTGEVVKVEIDIEEVDD